MALSKGLFVASFTLFLLVALAFADESRPELSPAYYKKTCPNLENAVRTVMSQRMDMAPAILRLFFHDCFVNGCDASVLLDRTDSMEREKDAEPANTSLAGFDVIDEIKSVLEHDCPATVSCADILGLASRDAVALLGGPSWSVPLGRMDSRRASKDDAESVDNLPNPNSDLGELLRVFETHGLDARDLTALSGAHTVGKAHSCDNYRDRIYGGAGRRRGAVRRADADAVRQQVLPGLAPAARPPHLRPGALHPWRGGKRPGGDVRDEPRGVLRGLREGDGEDGEHTPAAVDATGGEAQLQDGQQLMAGCMLQVVRQILVQNNTFFFSKT
ncbi:Os06g0521200 [Oryza sativa Japonica Group]|uniref:Peroxidase n=1 Tax=Oryza sativa subsp. japonica TaxID=39947 RepID=A0A0P0WX92_ORYSJ|nr:hypothetical protein EE612_034528 [Oryza sativa]BAS98007.1 Os06g0521200 [Oryza sativa Japonica Group]